MKKQEQKQGRPENRRHEDRRLQNEAYDFRRKTEETLKRSNLNIEHGKRQETGWLYRSTSKKYINVSDINKTFKIATNFLEGAECVRIWPIVAGRKEGRTGFVRAQSSKM